MNSSLDYYRMVDPGDQNPPAVEVKVVSSVAPPVCDTVGIGAERQGKEGGGVKKAEVRMFLAELKKQVGVVVIGAGGQSLGLRFGYLLDKENLKTRRGLSDRLYKGVAIPEIVARLEDGRYNAGRLGNIIKRMEQ